MPADVAPPLAAKALPAGSLDEAAMIVGGAGRGGGLQVALAGASAISAAPIGVFLTAKRVRRIVRSCTVCFPV